MQVIGDDINLDGYAVFRLRDVKRMKVPSPRRKFLEKALKLRGERRRSPGRVDVSSIRAALEWLNPRFPLIVIHREQVNPGVCWIGQIEAFDREGFRLYSISPDAQFHKERKVFAYSDVTRIDVDGGYENALALVAGLIPPRVHKRRATAARTARR